MKKCLLVLLAFLLLAGVALAAKKFPNHVDTKIFLTEKTPTTPDPPDPAATIWNLKTNGGLGYLTYGLWGPLFSFQFKGFNLQPNTPYELIYYPDPWPANGLKVLASGTSNGGGQILLKGAVDTGTLPPNYGYDDNFPGAKIWLVPNPNLYITGTAPNQYFFDWPANGAGILFETALINYYAID